MLAVITSRRLHEDLADRRLRTAQLRTVCTYIAATLQLAEGAENTMVIEAQKLSLGTGTEPAGNTADQTGGPVNLLPEHQRPSDPPSIAAGDYTPEPASGKTVPYEKLGGLLGAGAPL